MIVLNEKIEGPLYLQIYRQVKEEIVCGEITEGTRLPSVRALADTLGVSRNTVTSAYQQLCSEGYIQNKARSGFYARTLDSRFFNFADQKFEKPPQSGPEPGQTRSDPSGNRYDFQYGRLHPNDFPFTLWRKLSSQILSAPDPGGMVAYPDRRGDPGLRTEIMRYLYESRGVRCSPDQIVITPGTQISLSLLGRLLKQADSRIAMEDPGYDGARVVFRNNGLDIVPIGLETGGIRLDELEQSRVKAIYVTPSRQFPTGEIMPIQKRIRLLEWAVRHNAVIIEDDYDSELRYTGRPIPAIQGIDENGRVIYLGTFSKSLSPALRMSYMVIPEPMGSQYRETFGRYNNFVPWLEQKILEKFISQGHWTRHLRRIRQANKNRHDVLVRAIRETMGDRVVIHGLNAGLHVLLGFRDKVSEDDLIEKAGRHGVVVYPMSGFRIRTHRDTPEMILLGYSGMDEAGITDGIQLLNRAWFGS